MLAIMLGRLKMAFEERMKAYERLSRVDPTGSKNENLGSDVVDKFLASGR